MVIIKDKRKKIKLLKDLFVIGSSSSSRHLSSTRPRYSHHSSVAVSPLPCSEGEYHDDDDDGDDHGGHGGRDDHGSHAEHRRRNGRHGLVAKIETVGYCDAAWYRRGVFYSSCSSSCRAAEHSRVILALAFQSGGLGAPCRAGDHRRPLQ